MKPIDVRQDHLEIVRNILKQFVPDTEVWVFGSRVKWLARETSDLDLCLHSQKPTSFERLGLLREAFEDSNLPYKVDLVDWATTSASFRKVIERDKLVVQKGTRDAENSKSERHQYEVSRLLEDDRLIIGDGYRAKNIELSKIGIPFARAGNIDDGFHFDDADKVPPETLLHVGQKRSKPGDVVFTSKGTVGRFAFVREGTPEFVYSPQLCFWRSGDEKFINPRWLYYWMNSNEFFLQYKGVAGQTDMAEYVSLRDQRRMRITLPPIEEQQTIAHILGTLDDKIENNRRVNETLEAMTRAVFKSWFVEATVSSLPKGWREIPLPEAIEVNPPRPLRKGEVAPYLDMANMPTRSARALEVYDREFGSGMRFKDGDTLVARITPCLENGKTCFVDFLGEDKVGWGSTEYIVLQPKPPLPPEYAYFLARTDDFRAFAISNMTGTSGRQRVPSECFRNYPVVVPPAEIADRFGRYAKGVLEKMKANDEESRTLAAIRDALLPKLLSGEMRVKGGKKFEETDPVGAIHESPRPTLPKTRSGA